jgi:hypothetical protein
VDLARPVLGSSAMRTILLAWLSFLLVGSACEGGGSSGSGDAGGAGEPCPDGQSCQWGPDSCGSEAECQCVPAIQCDGPPTGPACGCDGETIEADYGACTTNSRSAPAKACANGSFACGDQSCTRNVEVCVITTGGRAGGEPSHACRPVAEVGPGCLSGIADCSCLDLTALGCADVSCCSADADRQETVQIEAP